MMKILSLLNSLESTLKISKKIQKLMEV